MSFTWIPKATVQAALSGVILAEALDYGLPTYIEYGITIQTTAVFSIIMCAPIGAVLISTFGPRYLKCDIDKSISKPKITLVENSSSISRNAKFDEDSIRKDYKMMKRMQSMIE